MDRTVGIVGAGSMARALVMGWVGARSELPAGSVWACNRSRDDRLDALAAMGVRVTRDKGQLCEAAGVIVLAVKPADAPAALRALAPHLSPERHLVISLVAGLPSAAITQLCGLDALPVVRAMSNTPSAVASAATAIAPGSAASAAHMETACALLSAVGDVITVAEEDLAAVTALSGSGPAYVYVLMEALHQAAGRLGLSAEVSRRLTAQTVLGAAKLALVSEHAPDELVRQVASPGGTTVAALEVLQARGFSQALVDAVVRAAERAGELALAAAATPGPAGE
ncbi:MAG TPA: pyrroline-5-carboxylate reductase [Bacillota bacterium]|nr:pyrroline-5-carboxylate reductase [Bacillota bacterium]